MTSLFERVRDQVKQANESIEDDVKKCRKSILDSIKSRILEQASLGSRGAIITFDNTVATVPECKPIIDSCSKGNLNACRQLSLDNVMDDFKKEKFDARIYWDGDKHVYISW